LLYRPTLIASGRTAAIASHVSFAQITCVRPWTQNPIICRRSCSCKKQSA